MLPARTCAARVHVCRYVNDKDLQNYGFLGYVLTLMLHLVGVVFSHLRIFSIRLDGQVGASSPHCST